MGEVVLVFLWCLKLEMPLKRMTFQILTGGVSPQLPIKTVVGERTKEVQYSGSALINKNVFLYNTDSLSAKVL